MWREIAIFTPHEIGTFLAFFLGEYVRRTCSKSQGAELCCRRKLSVPCSYRDKLYFLI